MNDIIKNILTRRSIRAFKEDQISEEELNTILVAGSYAPNGMGEQNWKFTAIQNAAKIKKEMARLNVQGILKRENPSVSGLPMIAKEQSTRQPSGEKKNRYTPK
ncbi:nitroreductase [Pseudobacteroides cellulosolvens ATCC 35603 = DSM 2933]|uniref:Nitroreductase n=1 Tax=Pseudobacteroides cellulosolvens ATCC 35603 = DSM 2933 TaxID=398512 RepID=A0A0L6JUR8_9FIRM|nr:nitroreductase [Pseudobacteroides cellulosolvens ATCC 35603 = DSM 2933]